MLLPANPGRRDVDPRLRERARVNVGEPDPPPLDPRVDITRWALTTDFDTTRTRR